MHGGESSLQLQDEVRALSKEERQRVLRDGGLSVEIAPEHGIAIQCDMYTCTLAGGYNTSTVL